MNKTAIVAFTLLSVLNLGCNKVKYYKTNAVETKLAALEINTSDKINAIWQFTAINKTNKDYSLPSNPNAIYLDCGNGLSQENEIKWTPGIYLPPGEKVSISFQVSYDYSDSCNRNDKLNSDKLSKFMKPKIEELNAFVIIDRQHKYKIVFQNEYKDASKSKSLKPVL